MSRETTLAAFSPLHRAQWKGEEAPHKPLLVLMALSQWLQSGATRFRYADVQDPLRELIREFGLTGSTSVDPRLPFWHLTNDHVWKVETPNGSPVHFTGRRPLVSELIDQDARGRFDDQVAADLYGSPGLVFELIGQLLCECFDPQQHTVLLQRLGLWLRS